MPTNQRIQFLNLQFFHITNAGRATTCLRSAVKMSCHHLFNLSFSQKLDRPKNAGFPQTTLVTVCEGRAKNIVMGYCISHLFKQRKSTQYTLTFVRLGTHYKRQLSDAACERLFPQTSRSTRCVFFSIDLDRRSRLHALLNTRRYSCDAQEKQFVKFNCHGVRSTLGRRGVTLTSVLGSPTPLSRTPPPRTWLPITKHAVPNRCFIKLESCIKVVTKSVARL